MATYTLKDVSTPFCCGDTVCEIDGRHTGRVEAIIQSTVKVRWANGWISYLQPDELEIVERVKRW